jgi:hypothetical protein
MPCNTHSDGPYNLTCLTCCEEAEKEIILGRALNAQVGELLSFLDRGGSIMGNSSFVPLFRQLVDGRQLAEHGDAWGTWEAPPMFIKMLRQYQLASAFAQVMEKCGPTDSHRLNHLQSLGFNFEYATTLMGLWRNG